MKISTLVFPVLLAAIGVRILSSQAFRSSKYGVVFDFGQHHQVIGSAILVLAIVWAWLSIRKNEKTIYDGRSN